jgi:hypothetical protein
MVSSKGIKTMNTQIKSIKDEILQQITTILNTQPQGKTSTLNESFCRQDDTGVSRLNVLTFALQIESQWGMVAPQMAQTKL